MLDTIQCPSCGMKIFLDDMNLRSMLGRCRSCRLPIDLKPYLPELSEAASLRQPEPMPPPPRGFKVEEQGDALNISWSWRSFSMIFAAAFCLFWDWTTLSLLSSFRLSDISLLWLLSPGLHVFLGLGMTYWVLAGLLNRTEILLDQELLRVWHGPVPTLRNHKILSPFIEQIHWKPRDVRTKNGKYTVYDVHAMLRDGSEKMLLRALHRKEEAIFIARRTQDWLSSSN